MKTTILLTVLICVMMSGIAVAEDNQTYGIMDECQNCPDTKYDTASLLYASTLETGEIPVNGIEENWAFGRRNFIPNNISGIMYDFEEGSNCMLPFNNMYPEVATFLTVLGTQPYGCDEPSYVSVGGSMCGATRCKMFIYPHPNLYYNGTPKNWVFIVNGEDAFSSITGPDYMGGYWPGTSARIQFKDDTHYISFLTSTGGDLRVRLYTVKGNTYSSVHYTSIPVTIHRIGTEPSDFTRYSVYLPDVDIARMDLYGGFNAWHIDDLVVGGEPGYIYERTDYGYAAERIKQLIGAPFNEYAIGYDLIGQEFLTADQIMDGDQSYYDPTTGEIEHDPGIYDQNAIVWAYNVRDGITEHVVNQYDIDKLEKFEFKEDVAYEDIQPGDVLFIDYPPADGQYNEVGMVIPEQIDPATNELVDCIRVLEDGGVQYGSTGLINDIYDVVDGFVDYRCLPESDRVGKCPYPKPTGKPI